MKHPDTTPEGGGGGPGPQHKARVELDAKRESDTRRRGDKKAAIAAAEVHEPIRRAESENGDHGRDDRRRSRQVGSKYERRRAVTRNRPNEPRGPPAGTLSGPPAAEDERTHEGG